MSIMRHNRTKSFKNASTLLGAFFCLLVTACSEKKNSTAEWENSTTETTAGESKTTETPTTPETGKSAQPDTAGKGEEVRFVAYNLKNYLTMRRYIDGEAIYKGKPEEEIKALIDVIKGSKPDVLGVCEIGSEKDLNDLQTRLKTAGIDLPHLHRVQGADTVRALAILSRYPIVGTAIPKKLDYTVSGVDFKISRGILDATVDEKTSLRMLEIEMLL